MLQNKHVLALEDEPVVAFLLEDMLLDAGAARVSVASRVGEAAAIVKEQKIEAAVLDVNVYGETSYLVADLLSEAGVPFIFASGYGDREHPSRYASAPTLTKPYSAADLRQAFEQLKP